jgi:hypothetical protein
MMEHICTDPGCPIRGISSATCTKCGHGMTHTINTWAEQKYDRLIAAQFAEYEARIAEQRKQIETLSGLLRDFQRAAAPSSKGATREMYKRVVAYFNERGLK